MPKLPDVQLRKFKRGDEIFSSSGRATSVYLVQSGLVSVCMLKDGCAQLQLVGPNQTIREEALLTGPPTGTSAIALRDTEILDFPIETVRALGASAAPTIGILLKGVIERLKSVAGEIRSTRINRDARPCPADLTAKVFGVIFYSARYVGEKSETTVEASWARLKNYAVEVFHEDRVRLEEAVLLLTKLGYAEPFEEISDGTKTIPSPEKWVRVCFRNMAQIETFFDFYQNYHFKGGYAALLKTSEKATELTQALVRIAENHKVDRSGLVTMPYKSTVDSLKELFGKSFEADQIFRLEQKGLMVKRISNDTGGLLTFFKPEFEQMLLNWKVLREVELWNEKGYVWTPIVLPEAEDATGNAVAEKESSQQRAAVAALGAWKPLVSTGGMPVLRAEPPQPNELLCDVCMSPVTASQTYCAVCDSELKKAS